MNRKILFGHSLKDILVSVGPTTLFAILALIVAYLYVDPAPPNRVTIATGDGEGDYQFFADKYRAILKEEGVDLVIRPSKGPKENLKLLEDDNSGVSIGFVQDGVGSPEQSPDVVSLGSVYYEPIWFFYRGPSKLTRLSQFRGKRIAIGSPDSGTQHLARVLLKENGIEDHDAILVSTSHEQGLKALKSGDVDAAVILATPDDPSIESMLSEPGVRVLNLDQAEAITRQIPYLHHLVLPHGAIHLAKNLPEEDIHLVAPTATLLVRDDLHPALVFLLLKAVDQVHSSPGELEKKDEFPSGKDIQFPLSSDAKAFYKSGGPFWQKYLPFWIAAWVDRFILIVIPIIALLLPLARLIPRIYVWRVRSRIFQRYGELKFLETQIKSAGIGAPTSDFFKELDRIEEKVSQMKVPLDFSDHVYSLRQHVDFVRERLRKSQSLEGLPELRPLK